MPYVNNKGVQIHYRSEGNGTPLVLHHWSFGTLEDWYDYGYVEGLKNDNQLILIDSRGNGTSDKFYKPEDYTLKNRVSDLVAVLDNLKIADSHFYGYSLGGWIGFGAALYAPGRFRSLIIGGQHPYEQSLSELREFAKYGIKNGHKAFIAMWEN